jgi:hypothetical protein|tara:strand:- start:357 stop:1226 length:870 start_codon:yes stop_codon:yes gene_type:complete
MKMKKLNTLVEDIYDTISVLNAGTALNITEEDLDAFGDAIKEALRKWSHPKERSSKNNLRMSNVGKPMRQLWYDLKSEEEDQLPLESSVFIKFLYGHILEEVVLLLVKLAGHEVTSEQKEVDVDGVLGHMDCKIDGEVIDIKTASGFAFKKFRDGTLRNDDPFGYMSQLSGYEESEQTNDGGFLALNKETGELALYCPEELDKPNVKKKIKTIRSFLNSGELPDQCYESVPEGKSGNMKLHRQCVYCRHKNTCHKDVNGGEGLRVFKYANKLVYFTKVVKEPRVPEITL